MTIAELEAKIAALTPKERELWDVQVEREKQHKQATNEWCSVYTEIENLRRELKIEQAVAERMNQKAQPATDQS